MAYRQATEEGERERLFDSIEGYSSELNFVAQALDRPATSSQDRSV
jgi:hypothetical protein